jgi:exopolysaccharide biosynthesis polyprenyl glycosylphosphotransferase
MPLLQWISVAERLGRLPIIWRLPLPHASDEVHLRTISEFIWIPIAVIPVTLLCLHILGGYRPLLSQSRTRVLFSSFVSPLIGLSPVTFVLIATRNLGSSRALIFSFTLLTQIGFLAHRFLFRSYKLRRLAAGRYARNVVVVGTQKSWLWLVQHFTNHVPPDLYRLYGHLRVPGDPASRTASNRMSSDHVNSYLFAEAEELGDLLIHYPIHEVIAIPGLGSDNWLSDVLAQCEYFHVTLRLVPEILLFRRSLDLNMSLKVGSLWLPEIVFLPRHLDSDLLFAKRLFDIMASAVLLVLLSPLFAVIAIAIKLTAPKLPVLYHWPVVGYKGRPFTGFKFTTMVQDADDRKADLMCLNEMTGPVFKIRNDPRITPLGRFLRKFSLNELPQLWSVLKGDMSLVGPRPAGPHELARYELWQKRKLCVQPGITCLWQTRGRNKVSNFDEWVRMDFEYIDNWSLWLDCRILVKTVWVVIAGTGS